MRALSLLALLCLLLHFTNSTPTGGLRVLTTDMKLARLDPTTGKLSCVKQLEIHTNCSSWDFGKGTRGQTSALFYENQTLFFVGREVQCPDGQVPRTVIFSAFGPYCYEQHPPEAHWGYLATLQRAYAQETSHFNIAWDHTCNLVVLSLTNDHGERIVDVNQVSEYDSQQRFQHDYRQPTGHCNDCWQKVDGAGALDFGDFKRSWPYGQEWYCGDKCLFHTIEEHTVHGVVVPPRAVVGRAYRTAQVMTNWTDSVQLQTLSWNPFNRASKLSQFLGLGICCSDYWCLSQCNPGNLILISFIPKKGFSILSEIGPVDQDSIRLGVEYSVFPFFKKETKKAYVFHERSVLTYELITDDFNVISGAKLLSRSAKIDDFAELHLWANAGSG